MQSWSQMSHPLIAWAVYPAHSTDNQLRRNDFIMGENSKMVGNYIRGKTKRPLEAGDDYDTQWVSYWFFCEMYWTGLIWVGNNSLAYYDIIDVTPGTNSDFVKKRSKDDIDNSDIKELIVKLVKVFHVEKLLSSRLG